MHPQHVDPAKRDSNLDPITSEPGSHPVATGTGAAAGAIAGGVAGAAFGPAGVAVGAIVGGVMGGLAGHEVGEQFDPTLEDAYWRANFKSRPYVRPEANYEHYEPAFRYGWEAGLKHAGKELHEVENELELGWGSQSPAPHLNWAEARPAAIDAWHRIERARRRGAAVEAAQEKAADSQGTR
jgi:hypothetical protein